MHTGRLSNKLSFVYHDYKSSTRRYGWLSTLLNGLIYLFIGSLILLPGNYQAYKFSLAGVLCLVAVFRMLYEKALHLNSIVLIWFLLYLGIGLFYSMIGIMNEASNIVKIILLYVVYPATYILIISQLRSESSVRGVVKLLIFCTYLVSLLVILKVLSAFGVNIPYFWYVEGLFSQHGLTNSTSYTPRVLSSLVFLFPFSVACLVVYSGPMRVVSRKLLWISFALSLMAVILSSRQVIMLLGAVMPVFIWVAILFMKGKNRKLALKKLKTTLLYMASLFIISVMTLNQFIDIDVLDLGGKLLDAFDVGANESAIIRAEQFERLISGFNQNPVTGVGLGVGLPDYTRDPSAPWNYELRYFALLYQTGFFGFLLYVAGVLWLLLSGRYVIGGGGQMATHTITMFSGLFGALISEATNPYLNQFGHLWMIFLPLAIVNIWLINKTTYWGDSKAVFDYIKLSDLSKTTSRKQ